MTRKRGWLWVALFFGLAACSVLSAPAGRPAAAAGAEPPGDAQTPLAGAAASPKAEASPEVWPQASAGLRGTLATLEAERKAAGFVRRKIATFPRLGGSVEAIGWSGEGAIIVVVASDGGHRARVFDLSTGAKWTAPLKPPAFEGLAAYTFLDETGPAPILLVWYPWYDPHSAKVVWAARTDCAEKRVAVLSEGELEAVRKRVQIVAAPGVRETDSHPEERPRTLRVMSGDGRTLRTIGLPQMQPIAEGLALPIPTFRGGLSPNCRTVAYGADPPSFLFDVYPDALILDPLLAEVLDTSPQMRISTGGVVGLRSDWPGKAVRQEWGSYTELTLACVDVAGDCVAFARRTETTFQLFEPPTTASLRVFDQGAMRLWDLRVASSEYGVQLVDFTAQVKRGWPGALPPPGESGWRAYWAEPPETAPSQPIAMEYPSLSPSGKRIVYLKNDALWLAERPGDGGGPAR